MAYLVPIETQCQRCLRKTAKVELLDKRNARYGRFCDSCGKVRLKQLLADEEKEREANHD